MLLGIDASRANHPHKSGVEWYAWFIIQELKKIVPKSWQVVLYSDKPLQGELAELPDNWTQKILNWPPRRLWTQIRLSTKMVHCPPDILFIPAHVPPLIHPAKTVMTVHDVAAWHFPKTYNWFERLYSLASAKYAVKNLPMTIVPSQAVKNDLLAFFKAKEFKIKVVPLGINYIFLNQMTLNQLNDIKNKYQLPPRYILSVGRLEEKKNTARIIAAYDVAVRLGGKFGLVLVGKPGYGYEKVTEAIKNSPNKNKIKIIPWVQEKDLPGIMQAAEIFIFPSLGEGFGLPVLEAFASRVPVITTNTGSLPEVAGDAARFVDPFAVDQIAQTMIELSRNEIKRAKLIETGLKQIQNFSWQKTAGETWQLLSALGEK